MAPTDSVHFFRKHFEEALLYNPWIQNQQSVLDMGSGGGFPGIPLAILNPNIHFYLLDKKTKCIEFLKLVCQELSLKNVTLLHARGDELGKIKIMVDVVLARAVSRIYDILSWSLPVLKENGTVVLGKKADIEKEVTLAEQLPFVIVKKINQPFGLLVVYQLDKNLTQRTDPDNHQGELDKPTDKGNPV